MYIYIVQAMPGCKAKFDGDTSVRYRVRRKYTSASSDQKSCNVDIRTDLSYEDATALAQKFSEKERESRALKHEGTQSPTAKA